ncbi:MAG: DNA polymerase III subunit gamma/tau [Prevotellaceae bacterium]|jgi:DNA polymerase-3 subunit gamma/tau|nr:DNA polymerase III subunit gamma/tau [Prevotellaceae bacterium]
MEQFVVSARKYRPQTFATVVGQASITGTLKNAITRKHLAHAYLFCGPRGVGKTTCARIFAKTINCLNPTAEMEACDQCESCRSFNEGRSYSIHELDAASNNSIEDIRQLIDHVRIPPQVGQYSVYIIDEVHMLSTAAFNAFLKTLEEPPAHAIFILATTEKHKILPTILSRCQIYDFNRIRVEDTVEYLKYIAGHENVTAEDAALHVIAQKADGAMRDALSIFDQVVSFCGNNLTYSQVIANLNVLDYDYYFKLTDAFIAHDYTQALLIFNDILSRGFEAQHFIAGLCTHFRDLLVCKDAKTAVLLEASESIRRQYVEQATKCEADFLFEALNLANRCDVGYKASGNPRLHAELCMLQIANIGNEKKNSDSNDLTEERSGSTTAQPGTYSAPVINKGVATARPATPSKPAPVAAPTLQIKNLLKNQPTAEAVTTQQVQPAIEQKEEQVNETNPFTQAELETAWTKFVAQLNNGKTRLQQAMQQGSPTLLEAYSVTFETNNTLYFNVLEEAKKDIVSFLKKALRNNSLSLSFTVASTDSPSKKTLLYKNSDKYAYLVEKNPALQTLKNALGLDF